MSARIAHRFVRAVPERLEPGVLYVSVDYLTTNHLCACGCGAEVVLPLHPTKWRMSFDGSSVTISPSVGSRTLPCRSHYLIIDGRIVWAERMSDADFARALARDRRDDDRWHRHDAPSVDDDAIVANASEDDGKPAPEARHGRRWPKVLEWIRPRPR